MQDTLVGTSVGGYTLIRLLGVGGMGSVYLANDPAIGQQVAVKIIRSDMDAYTDASQANAALERFRMEARAVGSLDHLHILPLNCYGEEERSGRAYMIMQYRPEGSLWDWLRKRADLAVGQVSASQAGLPAGLPTNWPLRLDEANTYLQQAASALQYAHDRGIVHRDIKPANFLLRIDEHTQAVHLLLSDFGLAKAFSASSGTQTILGTPTYMAPEQFAGAAQPASDQYALAVMFYYLVAGHPPFEGAPMPLMHKHINEPVPVIPHLSPAINAVFSQAMAKNPARRFPSVSAFATAFAQAAQGTRSQPLVARLPDTHSINDFGGQMSQPRLSVPSGPLIFPGRMPVAGQDEYNLPTTAAGPGAYSQAMPMTPRSQSSFTNPNSLVRPAGSFSNLPQTPAPGFPGYRGSLVQPGQQRPTRRSALGWILAGSSLAIAGSAAGAYFYWQSTNAANNTGTNNQTGNTGTTNSATATPGKTATKTTAKILNTLMGHTATVSSLSWQANGTQLASGGLDKMVNIWSPASATNATLSYNDDNVIRTVAWNNAGTELAIGGDGKILTLLNANTMGVLKNSSAFASRVQTVSWGTNDGVVYIGTFGNGIHTYDVNNGKTNFNKDIFQIFAKVYALEISPNGQMAAIGLNDGTVYLVDINDGFNTNATIRSNSYGSAFALSWSSDSSLLAVGYSNNVAIVYDVATQNQQYMLNHNSSVNGLAWKPNDTTTLATGSNENHVTVWKMNGGSASSTLYPGHTGPVTAVAWGAGGLVTGSKDTKIILWNA